MDIKQAVILAGGRGKRLGSITDIIPKPMVPIQGKPFLEHIIEMLKENGISEVVILAGYLHEKIQEYFGSGVKLGVRITYSVLPLFEETGAEIESGTRIQNAAPLVDNAFLLLYCDNYWPLNLEKLQDFYYRQNSLASVVVYSNTDHITKNNMLVDERGFVVTYDRERKDQNLNGVEIGFFIMSKKILELFPQRPFHFEKEMIPRLIEQRQLAGYLTPQRYYSISTPEKVETTAKCLQSKKVVFLDRDGVINKKPPRAEYVKTWKEFKFLEGALEGLQLLSYNNYDLYLITNQPGIARGLMSKQDLSVIHKRLTDELQKNNVILKGIYYCPHGWDEGCLCRKPAPGLLFQAASEHFINLSKTTFIGDDERDIEAGKIAGCKTILLQPGQTLLEVAQRLINN